MCIYFLILLTSLVAGRAFPYSTLACVSRCVVPPKETGARSQMKRNARDERWSALATEGLKELPGTASAKRNLPKDFAQKYFSQRSSFSASSSTLRRPSVRSPVPSACFEAPITLRIALW